MNDWKPCHSDKYLAGMRKLWGKKLSRRNSTPTISMPVTERLQAQSDDVSVGNADNTGDEGVTGA